MSGGTNTTAMVITAILQFNSGTPITLTGTTNVNKNGNTYGSGGMQDFLTY